MRQTIIVAAAALLALPLAAQQRDSVKPPCPAGQTCPAPGPHGQMGHAMGAGMGMAQSQGMMGGGMGQMMMDEMMGPMMRGMAFAPGNLLDHKDQLGLTAQQVTRLTQIRDAAKTAHDAAHHEAMSHMEELGKALAATAPDSAAVRAHFMGHHDAMGRAHMVMLRASIQAKAVLTPEQRGRVDGWTDARQMHRGMGPGGPPRQGDMPRRP